jgi:hypothetical protein
MTDDDTTTVWVCSARRQNTRIYHTDKECELIGETTRPWSLAEVEAFGYEKCSLCAADGDHGAINNTTDQSRSLRTLLEDDDSDVEYIDGHPGVDG